MLLFILKDIKKHQSIDLAASFFPFVTHAAFFLNFNDNFTLFLEQK